MTDQTDDPFDMVLDDEWDADPVEDDNHDPQVILARMAGRPLRAPDHSAG